MKLNVKDQTAMFDELGVKKSRRQNLGINHIHLFKIRNSNNIDQFFNHDVQQGKINMTDCI